MVTGRGKETGLAQPAWKGVHGRCGRIGDQAIDLMCTVVVEKVEFAVVGFAEGDQVQRRASRALATRLSSLPGPEGPK